MKKGLAAAEGQPLVQGIFPKAAQDVLRLLPAAALRVVGGGIVAAGAVSIAALYEDRQAKAGAVYDGILLDSRQLKAHALTSPPGRA